MAKVNRGANDVAKHICLLVFLLDSGVRALLDWNQFPVCRICQRTIYRQKRESSGNGEEEDGIVRLITIQLQKAHTHMPATPILGAKYSPRPVHLVVWELTWTPAAATKDSLRGLILPPLLQCRLTTIEFSRRCCCASPEPSTVC